MRVTYISWAPHCSRSDCTARELGGTSRMVYWGWLGSHPATVWLKYIGQALGTWKVLVREHPGVVFVMSPPPVAVVPVYIYCALKRIPYVVDAHSGVFLTKRWRLFQGFQFWLCRRAVTTIVTNDHLAALVRSHGGRATIVPDVPIQFDMAARPPAQMDGFTVVFVTSFDRDEPVSAMVETARHLPNIRFFMTGDPKNVPRSRLYPLPANLTLTGFLPTAAYGALLRHAGVVVALTTDDYTMQRAAYEAIYQGTPVIVSNTQLLRQSFDEGAVHVDNSPDAIVKAILRVRDNAVEYRQAASRLRARKIDLWVRTKSALLATLNAATAPPA
jgi:glycosyltransferase involved in cell wall biosynthesis